MTNAGASDRPGGLQGGARSHARPPHGVLAAAALLAAGPLPAATAVNEPGTPSEVLVQRADADVLKARRFPPGSWTVQIVCGCEEKTVRDALAAGDAGSPRWLAPWRYGGGTCYRVFAGLFATRREALAAARRAPVRYGDAVPIPVASIAAPTAGRNVEASALRTTSDPPPPAFPARATPAVDEIPPEPEPVVALPRTTASPPPPPRR